MSVPYEQWLPSFYETQEHGGWLRKNGRYIYSNPIINSSEMNLQRRRAQIISLDDPLKYTSLRSMAYNNGWCLIEIKQNKMYKNKFDFNPNRYTEVIFTFHNVALKSRRVMLAMRAIAYQYDELFAKMKHLWFVIRYVKTKILENGLISYVIEQKRISGANFFELQLDRLKMNPDAFLSSRTFVEKVLSSIEEYSVTYTTKIHINHGTVDIIHLNVNNEEVGMVGVTRQSHMLCDLLVYSKYRGKGYANKLMEEAIKLEPKYLIANAPDGGSLTTEQLVEFYGKCGFIEKPNPFGSYKIYMEYIPNLDINLSSK